VAAPFAFQSSIAFRAEGTAEELRVIPAQPGVFALYGKPGEDGREPEPYLTRAADLRRRIARLLAPPELAADGTIVQSRRLNLRERVARIAWSVTGSEFESALVLHRAAMQSFGVDEARRRLRLHTPFFLRFTAENRFPRVYATNRLSRRGLDTTYGPFPSRVAAERYCDAVLDLFKLRRCWEDLTPSPEHPGCIYGEMGKCLRPCQRAQEPEPAAEYTAEATAVRRFFETRGESMIVELGLAREDASAGMRFEEAAELHAQWQKVRGVQALCDELVQPIPKLRALIVQKQGPGPRDQGSEGAVADLDASVFLLHGGCVFGPERLSTLGVRAVREQTSVGSSLFAQPLMLQAVPLAQPGEPATPALPTPTESPEARAAAVVTRLEEAAAAARPAQDPASEIAMLSDHLAILRRWYYRPEKQRAGEIFFPDVNHQWPMRRLLNGAARVVLGDPGKMSETQRELAQRNPADAAQKPVKTKILHEGRPDVERVVPVVEKPFRSRRRPNEPQ
jgi:hypothetical protein